ncbi:uncharacterized protein LOC144451170 isoform X3 [Glandiceps talaboti]
MKDLKRTTKRAIVLMMVLCTTTGLGAFTTGTPRVSDRPLQLFTQEREPEEKILTQCRNWASITCNDGEHIRINSAVYGQRRSGSCDVDDVDILCSVPSITANLSEWCNDNPACDFLVGGALFGDDCPGPARNQFFSVNYVCIEQDVSTSGDSNYVTSLSSSRLYTHPPSTVRITLEEDTLAANTSEGPAPVAYWPLDSQHNTQDISGNGNHGVAANATLDTNAVDTPKGAYVFHGHANSFIEFPNNGAYDTTYSIHLMAHIYPTGSHGPIFNFKRDGSGVHMWQTKETQHFAKFVKRDITLFTRNLAIYVLEQNEWNFVGASYDYKTGVAKLWKDDQVVSRVNMGQTQIATQYETRMGARIGDDRYFTGMITCMSVYDKELSQSEIRQVMAKCSLGEVLSTTRYSSKASTEITNPHTTSPLTTLQDKIDVTTSTIPSTVSSTIASSKASNESVPKLSTTSPTTTLQEVINATSISTTSNKESYPECYYNENQTDYRGTVSVTVSGRTCQNWTSQSPHPHADWTPQTRPNEGLGDHNYCRTAAWDGIGAWCYTTDPNEEWEYCDLPDPLEGCAESYPECYYNENQTDYRGTVSVTVSGRTCQNWTSQSPHPHADWTPQTRPNEGLGDHNYCRTAAWDGIGAWCYTTDPNEEWEYCDLPDPLEGCVLSTTRYSSKASTEITNPHTTSPLTTLQDKIDVTTSTIPSTVSSTIASSKASNESVPKLSTTSPTTTLQKVTNATSYISTTSNKVTNDGSEYCKSLRKRGIDWPDTQRGQTIEKKCPTGSNGKATWKCDDFPATWTPSSGPNLSLCKSSMVELITDKLDDVKTSDDVTNITNTLVDLTNPNQELYGGDVIGSLGVINKLPGALEMILSTLDEEERQEFVVNTTQSIANTCSNLLDAEHSNAWLDLHDELTQEATKLLTGMENSGFLLVNELSEGSVKMQVTENIFMEVTVKDTNEMEDEPVRFPETNSISYDSDWKTVQDSISLSMENLQARSVNGTAKLVVLIYNQIGQYLDGRNFDGNLTDNATNFVATRVFSASINSMQSRDLAEPAIIVFQHTKPPENRTNRMCSFWNYTINGEGEWSDYGCNTVESNETHTVCSCSHLTNFAVLVDVHGTKVSETHRLALSIITYFGFIVSIFCLVLCLISFICLKNIQSDRTTIHKNLSLSLLVGEVLFLAGISQTTKQLACTTLAIFLHFSFLSVFSWMMLEGVELYFLLVIIFRARHSRRKYYYMFGYGVPAIIVCVSIIVDKCLYNFDGYGTELYCWLNTRWGFISAFVGPVCFVVLINTGFLIMAIIKIRRSTTLQTLKKNEDVSMEKFRLWLKTTCALICLLGFTWLFGFLYVNKDTVVMAYVFTLLNSLQGVFIFIFHCLLDGKVIKEYKRIARRSGFFTCCDQLSADTSSNQQYTKSRSNMLCKKVQDMDTDSSIMKSATHNDVLYKAVSRPVSQDEINMRDQINGTFNLSSSWEQIELKDNDADANV